MISKLIIYFAEEFRGLVYSTVSFISGLIFQAFGNILSLSKPIINPYIAEAITLFLQWLSFTGAIVVAVFTVMGYCRNRRKSK